MAKAVDGDVAAQQAVDALMRQSNGIGANRKPTSSDMVAASKGSAKDDQATANAKKQLQEGIKKKKQDQERAAQRAIQQHETASQHNRRGDMNQGNYTPPSMQGYMYLFGIGDIAVQLYVAILALNKDETLNLGVSYYVDDEGRMRPKPLTDGPISPLGGIMSLFGQLANPKDSYRRLKKWAKDDFSEPYKKGYDWFKEKIIDKAEQKISERKAAQAKLTTAQWNQVMAWLLMATDDEIRATFAYAGISDKLKRVLLGYRTEHRADYSKNTDEEGNPLVEAAYQAKVSRILNTIKENLSQEHPVEAEEFDNLVARTQCTWEAFLEHGDRLCNELVIKKLCNDYLESGETVEKFIADNCSGLNEIEKEQVRKFATEFKNEYSADDSNEEVTTKMTEVLDRLEKKNGMLSQELCQKVIGNAVKAIGNALLAIASAPDRNTAPDGGERTGMMVPKSTLR